MPKISGFERICINFIRKQRRMTERTRLLASKRRITQLQTNWCILSDYSSTYGTFQQYCSFSKRNDQHFHIICGPNMSTTTNMMQFSINKFSCVCFASFLTFLKAHLCSKLLMQGLRMLWPDYWLLKGGCVLYLYSVVAINLKMVAW